jgi:hypothetical protein
MAEKRGDQKRCPECDRWVPRDVTECIHCHARPWHWNHESMMLVVVTVIGLLLLLFLPYLLKF